MEKLVKRIKYFISFLITSNKIKLNKTKCTFLVASYTKDLLTQIDSLGNKITHLIFVNRSLYQLIKNENIYSINDLIKRYKITIFLGDPIWFKEEEWLERHKETWKILKKNKFIDLIIPYQFNYFPKKYNYKGSVSLVNLDKLFVKTNLSFYMMAFPLLPYPFIHNSGLISLLICSHLSKKVYVSGLKLNYVEFLFPFKNGKAIQRFIYENTIDEKLLNQSYYQRLIHLTELVEEADFIVSYLRKTKTIVFLTEGCILGWN